MNASDVPHVRRVQGSNNARTYIHSLRQKCMNGHFNVCAICNPETLNTTALKTDSVYKYYSFWEQNKETAMIFFLVLSYIRYI